MDPVGKTVLINSKDCEQDQNCQRQLPLIITGVIRDLPHNTQLVADLLIPNTSAADPMSQAIKKIWVFDKGWGYVQLAPGANSDVVLKKLKTIIDQSVDPSKLLNVAMPGSNLLTPRLIHFRDAHLTTDNFDSMTPPGSETTVFGFGLIGVLILLVASFNFTNLATATASLRRREISLRKVMGATRGQLISQFLGETFITTIVALIFSLALVEILLPLFNRLLDAPVSFDYAADWPLLLGIIGVAIAVGLLGGIYPALVLSAFKPVVGLRTNSAAQSRAGSLRTVLVVAQFAVSIGLGIAAIVVFSQISFARSVDLGFEKNGILVVEARDMSPSKRESFAQALRANPSISDVAISDMVPLDKGGNNVEAHVPGSVSHELFRMVSGSPQYMQLYDIRLLAGRHLSPSRGEDTYSGEGKRYNILINATTARGFGFSPQTAIGKTVRLNTTDANIVGVIADIKMQGASQPAAGTIYRYGPEFSDNISVRIKSQSIPDTLEYVDKTWRGFEPSIAIRRHFLTETFEKQFRSVEREGFIFGLFVLIAIFIACLGLFGLAAFTAQQRTKEIGLRKVFGAKSRDIVLLLLWQFTIPVLAANLIAWPVAYYYLNRWLEGYADRISLNPLYFVLSGISALIIAWATIYLHAARVANANPIGALRYE
jgi:putative ABC transport system permease protein